MSIPTHLQSTVDLLNRAFGDIIEYDDYLALLAVLGEHMCEENIGITVAHQFGRHAAEVTNDLAKVQSTQPPPTDALQAVRSRLEKVGLEDWLKEDEP